MPSKGLIFTFMTVGCFIGAYVPVLFGVSAFSFISLFAGAAGGMIGIWLAFRLFK